MAVLSLCGCEKGCLAKKADEAVSSGAQPSVPLDGVDCPDGLARCSGGVVEASRLAHVPQPCVGPPEKCACPWERAGDCDRGCVADGVEIVVARARAVTQLCAPDRADVLARAVANPALESGYCEAGEVFRCTKGIVVACVSDAGLGPMAFAECVKGCVEEGAFVDEDLTRDQVTALLCAH